MKLRVLIVVCIISILAIVMACSSDTAPATNSSSIEDNTTNLIWSVVKSPITGTCYQIATHEEKEKGNRGYGYMGMDRVDCSFYKGY